MSSVSPSASLDWILDKSLVLGYSKVGPSLRRRWWPHDAPSGSLAGKHVVVTGASGGLGLATAGGLAELGADVHLVGRSAERLEQARGRLLAGQPGARLHTAVCDVSDLESVEAFCADLAGRVTSLHALVHNAGVMPPERSLSAQGHELTLATHVLGPHLMTFRLADVLRGGRVVVVSSGGMYGQRLPVEDYEYEQGEYSGVSAYARTKRMQVVLAGQWAGPLARQGITVASMHPGWADTPGVTDSLPRFSAVMGPLLRSAEEGADTVVWLSATPRELPSGLFWHDRRPRPTHYAPVRRESAEDVARLWEFVRAETGVPAR
jgi:NAD(P)-dependent dehydrogenase (short-subunit alcohol dehydrogenase family)